MGCRPALVLLAGSSGSGKSHLARESGLPRLRLDEFYRDFDAPDLPRAHGIVDWDDPATWDGDAAMAAIRTLLTVGEVTVPVYDISTSRRVGSHVLRLSDFTDPAAGERRVVVAEGIFAPELVGSCQAEGIDVTGIWLHRPQVLVFLLRLVRDLRQRRKPPLVLLRRGLALLRQDPARRHAARLKGCQVRSMTGAKRLLARLRACPSPRPWSDSSAPPASPGQPTC